MCRDASGLGTKLEKREILSLVSLQSITTMEGVTKLRRPTGRRTTSFKTTGWRTRLPHHKGKKGGKNTLKLSIQCVLDYEKGSRPVNLSICLRQLSGKGLHTVQGLVGYCRKDKVTLDFSRSVIKLPIKTRQWDRAPC
jgi:hypothetical protein